MRAISGCAFAAERGDYLVVGVQPEGTRGAVMPAPLRLEVVRSIACVNHAFVLADRPERFIAALQPAVVVKGKEHEARLNAEQEVIASYGGQLLFSSGELTFSSVELIRQEFSEILLSTIVKPDDYPRRHGFGAAQLKRTLTAFKNLRVLIIGDLIVDEYIACDPIGMSEEIRHWWSPQYCVRNSSAALASSLAMRREWAPRSRSSRWRASTRPLVSLRKGSDRLGSMPSVARSDPSDDAEARFRAWQNAVAR